ncbi:hypothetical protein [Paractinoplanes lichenicola]|uniref:Uncharacterized protein n=1 Tax=Paractinoplanes lichenicola TaxID=2802976 RepID=A0ABS1VQA4_9ACTN|nr:hypothetical protein [Actinoplanes lichenicola]MBL7256656.1 hypothetical protein [Actinoplanes lichenicola]
MGENGTRQGIKEFAQVATMWLGFGEPDTPGAVPARPGALFMIVQTVAAVAVGAVVAVIRATLTDRELPASFPLPYLLLAIPLAIAVARHPAASPIPLTAALPSGALVAVLALIALPGDGFWHWFAALSAAALVAGAAFGAVADRRSRT